MDAHTIISIEIWPVTIPITDAFVVATGRMETAHNLFVRVTLRDGSAGYGEIAPFYDITGEDVHTSLGVAKTLGTLVLGQPATRYRHLARQFLETVPGNPAARCGLETAIVDALTRSAKVPLWGLWGGADTRPRETDITIPICDSDHTLVLAHKWYTQRFRIFKIKVGLDPDRDIHRMISIHQHFPDVAFIIDANQGYTKETMRHLVREVQKREVHVLLLEQPVSKEDIDGFQWLRHELRVPVAADESACTLQDVRTLITRKTVDILNIKIMKSGLIEAGNMAMLARHSGMGLMIGGMVETRVAMGCSLSLVLGLGGFDILDLDTPLLLTQDPVKGGYTYSGPLLNPWDEPGLAMESLPSSDVCLIE